MSDVTSRFKREGKDKRREKQYLPASSEGSNAAKRERRERFTEERRQREAEKQGKTTGVKGHQYFIHQNKP